MPIENKMRSWFMQSRFVMIWSLFCTLIFIAFVLDWSVQRGIGESEWSVRMRFDKPLFPGDSLVIMQRHSDETWVEHHFDITNNSSDVEVVVPLTVTTTTWLFSHSSKPVLARLFLWIETTRADGSQFSGPHRLCNIKIDTNQIIKCSVCPAGDESSWVPRPRS